MPDPSFWRGKRVFLTGHTGFKGAWLALWLQRLGAGVTGYALPPATTPSLFEAAHVADGMVSVIGDVRDLAALQATMQAAEPEVVLHLAAQALVRPGYADPVATFASNVMGTVHVAEAARQAGSVRALVCVTSDKCYLNRAWAWAYRETDALGGHDPYSASKAASEIVMASYRDAFLQAQGVGVATARAGNVIGGGDWSPERLLPDLLAAAEAGRAAAIRCPEATRPWQHVLDALSGYLLLAQRLHAQDAAAATAWNFGPDSGDVRSVRQVVAALARHLPLQAEFASRAPTLHEARALCLDSALARQRLHWTPAWNFDQAIEHVAAWHTDWRRGRDARTICLEQIADHGHALEQQED